MAEASHGLEAISATRRHKPSLLVLDAAMPLAKRVGPVPEAPFALVQVTAR